MVRNIERSSNRKRDQKEDKSSTSQKNENSVKSTVDQKEDKSSTSLESESTVKSRRELRSQRNQRSQKEDKPSTSSSQENESHARPRRELRSQRIQRSQRTHKEDNLERSSIRETNVNKNIRDNSNKSSNSQENENNVGLKRDQYVYDEKEYDRYSEMTNTKIVPVAELRRREKSEKLEDVEKVDKVEKVEEINAPNIDEKKIEKAKERKEKALKKKDFTFAVIKNEYNDLEDYRYENFEKEGFSSKISKVIFSKAVLKILLLTVGVLVLGFGGVFFYKYLNFQKITANQSTSLCTQLVYEKMPADFIIKNIKFTSSYRVSKLSMHVSYLTNEDYSVTCIFETQVKENKVLLKSATMYDFQGNPLELNNLILSVK